MGTWEFNIQRSSILSLPLPPPLANSWCARGCAAVWGGGAELSAGHLGSALRFASVCHECENGHWPRASQGSHIWCIFLLLVGVVLFAGLSNRPQSVGGVMLKLQ